MTMDLNVMQRIVEKLFTVLIAREHGNEGSMALRTLIPGIRMIYQHVQPDNCNGSICVFRTLDAGECPMPLDSAQEILEPRLLTGMPRGSFVVQVLENGRLRLWSQSSADPESLSDRAVVYHYANRIERFFAKGKSELVDNPCPTYPSVFCLPTFDGLEQALEEYKQRCARHSSCPILSGAGSKPPSTGIWRDADRVFLRNRPESLMRDSLINYLSNVIRAAVDVHPEQNVDFSKPVDIKVIWAFSTSQALIEVKWLGTPKFEDGHLGEQYSDARANEGAEQLADYLNRNKPQVPDYVTCGYLVVFDARRKGLGKTTTSVNTADGLYYEDRDIVFNAEHHKTRDDFRPPIRMFMEPVCR